MALDPTQEHPNSGWRTAAEWPDALPSGVTKDDAKYYAYERIYNDGRREWVFFQRGAALEAGQAPNDKPLAVMPDAPSKMVKDAYDKEVEVTTKPRSATPQVSPDTAAALQVEIDTNYRETGRAETNAARADRESKPQAASAAGTRVDIEGTPDPSKPGGWDNSRPRKITRNVATGAVVSDVPLAGAELKDWQEAQAGSAGPTTAVGTKPLEGHPGWQVGTRTEKDAAGNQTSSTYYLNPQGQETMTPPAGAADTIGKPTGNTRQRREGGKDIKETEYALPDGKTVWRTQEAPAEQVKPDRVPDPNVPGGFLERGTDGVYRPIKVEQQSGPAGPALPQIIVGQSEAALRSYADQLTAEVAAGRMTAARRDALLGQSLQIAQVAVQDATLIQRETESRRNAQVNVATTLYTGSMNGMQNALEFVSKFIGKLPEGSTLGGKGFAAILGMQTLMAHRSGLYDVQRSIGNERSAEGRGISASANAATATTSAQVARLTDPNNPEAVEADRQRVASEVTTAAAPPPEAAPGADGGPPPPDPALTAPGGPGAPVEPIFRPQSPVGAPATAATPQAAPGTPPAAPAADMVWVRDTSTRNRQYVPRSTLPTWLMPGSPWVVEEDAAPVGMAAPSDLMLKGDTNTFPPPPGAAFPFDAGRPPRGVFTTPEGLDATNEGIPGQRPGVPALAPWQGGGPMPTPGAGDALPPGQVAMTPPAVPDYAVLARQMQPPQAPPSGPDYAVLAQQMRPPEAIQAQPPIDFGEPAVLMYSRAASAPPWRFSPEELQQFQDAGVPDEVVWSTPKWGAA